MYLVLSESFCRHHDLRPLYSVLNCSVFLFFFLIFSCALSGRLIAGHPRVSSAHIDPSSLTVRIINCRVGGTRTNATRKPQCRRMTTSRKSVRVNPYPSCRLTRCTSVSTARSRNNNDDNTIHTTVNGARSVFLAGPPPTVVTHDTIIML